ncbi:hypothetical protein J6590_053692 [Homalodisca vitripennis]|nr:hypothetical protein J6590_053692 [Homalodisca vitripennis]
MPSRVLVFFSKCQWVQTIMYLCVFVHNTYDVYILTRVSSPISTPETCGTKHAGLTVRLENTTKFQNGSVYTGIDIYPVGSYWVDNNTVWGCPCYIKFCIPKCCPNGFSFVSISNRTCADEQNKSFRDLFISTLASNSQIHKEHNLDTDNYLVFDSKVCDEFHDYFELETVDWSVLDNDVFDKDPMFLGVNDCFEKIINSSNIYRMHCFIDEKYDTEEEEVEEEEEEVKEEEEEEKEKEEEEEYFSNTVKELNSYIRYLSVACLFLTLAIYMIIPQLQNLQGKFIISYLLSLTTFYVSFYYLTMNESSNWIHYTFQFSALAFLSWLLVLCKDISDMVKNPLQSRPLGKPYWGTYLLYTLFGWGVPFVFTVLTASVGVVPYKSDSCYQQDHCFFDMDRTVSLFMDVPSSVIAEVNFVIFLSLVWNLRSHFRQTDGISSQQTRENVEGFFLYLKLAFITGLNWFLFLYTLEINNNESVMFSNLIMLFFDSQGLILSVLLLCNRRVFGLLRFRCRV